MTSKNRWLVGLLTCLGLIAVALTGVFQSLVGEGLSKERAGAGLGRELAGLEQAREADAPAHAEEVPKTEGRAPERGEQPSTSRAAAFLSVTVLDSAEAPLTGVIVEAIDSPEASFNTFDLEFEAPRAVRAEGRTDGEGRARLELPRHRPFEVVVSLEGHATARLPGCYAGEDVRLRMERGCELQGRVTSAADGSPVSDVLLRVWGVEDVVAVGHTGSNGDYRIVGLPSGEAWLQVVPPAHAMPRQIELELLPGRAARRDVVLESGLTIRGQVRDGRTGVGLPDAEVSSWSFLGKTVRTDVHGHYELRGVREQCRSIAARAQGYGRGEQALAARAEAVDFELEPGRAVAGRVVDPEGVPLQGALVSLCGNVFQGGAQNTEWRTVTTDAQGRFSAAGLRTDLPLWVFARLEGRASLTRAVPAFDPRVETQELPDLVLVAHAVLAGRVLDAQGQPLEGRSVQLMGPSEGPGFGEEISVYLHLRTTETDARGRFSFADLAAGSFLARVSSRGSCPESREVILGSGEQRTEEEWRLPASRSLGGTVLGPDGAPLAGAFLVLQGRGDVPAPALSVESDEAGRFRFEGICPFDYSLRATSDLTWSDGHALAPLLLEEVEFDGRELELRLSSCDGLLQGQVLDEAGAAVSACLVSLGGAGRPRWGAVLSDEQGRFRIEAPADSTHDLRAWRTKPLDASEGAPTVLESRLGRRLIDAARPSATLEHVRADGSELQLRLVD